MATTNNSITHAKGGLFLTPHLRRQYFSDGDLYDPLLKKALDDIKIGTAPIPLFNQSQAKPSEPPIFPSVLESEPVLHKAVCSYQDSTVTYESVPSNCRLRKLKNTPCYGCDLYGKCTPTTNIVGVPSCATCPHYTSADLYSQPSPPPVNTSYFDKVFVIAVPKLDDDRLKRFFTEVDQMDWPFAYPEHWPGVLGANETPPKRWSAGKPAWGCYLSHLQILRAMKREQWQRVLVFECDATFLSTFPVIATKFLEEIPSLWEMIYLGGQNRNNVGAPGHIPKIHYSDHAYLPWDVNRTHALGWQLHFVDFILNYLKPGKFARQHHVDHHLGRLHQTRSRLIFCCNPWQVGQHGGKSLILGKKTGTTFFK